ncbi:DUF3152 domain-containing protein [Candidatus Saccharibacteria bacterium]|nr:DUF3152 domain-containing protein [Candidatus Saccharibacteria bacterium]
MVKKLLILTFISLGTLLALGVNLALAENNSSLADNLTATKIQIPFPANFKKWPEPAATPTSSTSGGVVTLTYSTTIWGTVTADFADFRAKVAQTLADSRGWVRANVRFQEVDSGADFQIILSDPDHLEALPGCSGELSCTTWSNQVIINDLRWLGGTPSSNAHGVSQRDYQHMVVNHEVGHWLGHYNHIESCPNGGPAPIMLQQSTGLRGCDSFNSWPLDSELWTRFN